LKDAIRSFATFLIFNPCFGLAVMACAGLALCYDTARPDYPVASNVPAEVIAWVSAPVQLAGDFDYLEVTPLEIRQRGRRLPAYPGHVALYVTRTSSGGAEALLYADIIRFETYLDAPTHYDVPGALDYREYLWRQGLLHVARLKSPLQLERRGIEPSRRWLRPIFRYAWEFERHCASSMTRPQTQFVLSLFLGRGKALKEVDVDDLKRLGILHIFVVSGSHVSLLLICLHLVFGRLGGAGKIVTLAGVWAYIAIVGCAPPVLRSGVMATILYLLLSAGLGRRFMNALGLSALLLLAWFPPSLDSSSFQLSYLCLCAIGLLALPARRGVGRLLRGVGKAFSETISVTRTDDDAWERRARYLTEQWLTLLPRKWGARLAAWSAAVGLYLSDVTLTSIFVPLLLLPVCLYYSNLWVWTQSVSNLLLVPLYGLAVPLCLLLFLLFWTPVSGPLGWIVGAYADLIMGLTDKLAGFAWLDYVAQPSLATTLAYLVVFPASYLLLKGRRKALALLAPAALFVALVLPDLAARPERFTLTLLDVGQAESIHLGYPNGADALIDTGGSLLATGPDRKFVAERVISRYLWHEGRHQLEYVMLTHSHADHTGGYPFIQAAFPVSLVYYGKWDELYRGPTARRLQAGDKFTLGGVEHFVLSAPRTEAPEQSTNNESLVVLARYGRFSALLTGDAENETEGRIAALVPPVTVFKLGHHGGRYSSSPAILEAARPALALISAGRKNPFGHPSVHTLARLRRLRIPWLSTGAHGTIRVETDGVTWEVSRYSSKEGRFVKMGQFSGALAEPRPDLFSARY
jgi:competence protein ComEC